MQRLIRFSGVVLGAISLSSCAEDTVSVGFNVTYSSDVTALVAAAPTYVRMFYSYDGLSVTSGSTTRSASVVQPAETVPTVVQVGSGNSAQLADNWAAASQSGSLLVGRNGIQLLGLPLGHTNTQIGIEFLQARSISGSVQYFVVAYGCIAPIPEALTKEVLNSYVSNPSNAVLMQKGRTCGSCARAAENPADITSYCSQ